MASGSGGWTWNATHGDYYRYDSNGRCIWAKQQQSNPQTPQAQAYSTPSYQQPASTAAVSAPAAAPHEAFVSNHGRKDYRVPDDVENRSDPNMAPSAPANVPLIYANSATMMRGTPQRGWYESLDSSYRMRTSAEAHKFFKRGKVFAMLYAETASETTTRRGTETSGVTVRSGITRGQFNQRVFSQIRRFVIVKVIKESHFVYALPIFTYGRRGTTKRGCHPSEHTIVYFSGQDPQSMYLQDEYGNTEYENGMTKEPIEIIPAVPGPNDPPGTTTPNYLDPTSRLRFGKMYPIEWNVKVKDVGKVKHSDMPKLLKYWQEENQLYSNSDESDFEDEDYTVGPSGQMDQETTPTPSAFHSPLPNYQPAQAAPQPTQPWLPMPAPAQHHGRQGTLQGHDAYYGSHGAHSGLSPVSQDQSGQYSLSAGSYQGQPPSYQQPSALYTPSYTYPPPQSGQLSSFSQQGPYQNQPYAGQPYSNQQPPGYSFPPSRPYGH